jgi:hypothetical protein
MATEKSYARKDYIEKIKSAAEKAKSVSAINHHPLEGKIREILIQELLQPILPLDVSIGSGKVADSEGNLSNEMDIILYSKNILPPVLFDEKTGIFPIEACLYLIQVKTVLTAKELKKAIENAKSLERLKPIQTNYYYGNAKKENVPTPLPVYLLFAFDSDLKNDKTEFERYLECDNEGTVKPTIKVFCVMGKGYWYLDNDKKWYKFDATENYDEVISLLGGVTNTLPIIMAMKGRPPFGKYLIAHLGRVVEKVEVARPSRKVTP